MPASKVNTREIFAARVSHCGGNRAHGTVIDASSSNGNATEENSFNKQWNQDRGSAAWYCLRSRRNKECVAAAHLKALANVQVFCPRIRFRRRSRRSQKSALFTDALFPGYFFARFPTTEILPAVERLSGIRGIVSFNEKHAVVKEEVIEALRVETETKMNGLAAGDRIRLTDRGIGGLEAVITDILSGGERVQTLVDFLVLGMSAEGSEENAWMNGRALTILRFSARFTLTRSSRPLKPPASIPARLAEQIY